MYIEKKKRNCYAIPQRVDNPSYSIGTRPFYMIQFTAC